MELIINEDVLSNLPSIKFNSAELKEGISKALEKYTNRKVAPETMAQDKEDRAKLNKLYNQLDEKRKEIKKLWNKSFEEFESDIKEIMAMIEEVRDSIDVQIKEFETAERERKAEKIESYFNENAGELPIELDAIFKTEWLNKTFAFDKIKKVIDESITSFKNGISVIESLNSPYEAHIKKRFSSSLNLASSISEGNAEGEALKKFEPQEFEILPSESKDSPIEHTVDIPPVIPTAVISEVETVDIRIFVTTQQKAAVKEFMRVNNIRYSGVPVVTENIREGMYK